MLEKKPGNLDIKKLQVILLLEANFNVANKIIFNIRLVPTLEWLYGIPNKVIGRRRA